MAQTTEQRKRVWVASWMSAGVAPSDAVYHKWIEEYGLEALDEHGKSIGVTDYAAKRMLGWQAGGNDVPRYGEYATPPTPYHEVPPFPEDAPTDAPATHQPAEPVPQVTIIDLTAVEDRLDKLEVSNQAILKRIESLRLEFLTSVRQLAASGLFGRLFGR